MTTDFQKIKNAVERAIHAHRQNFIIYPYGEFGIITKQILNECFGIQEKFIIDNKLSKYNSNIKDLDVCKNLDVNKYTVLFTCVNPDIYEEVYNQLKTYFPDRCIIEIWRDFNIKINHTKCGKYSFGPLCDHEMVESVGAFCSFAFGADVVGNHPINYLSTHPFLCIGGVSDPDYPNMVWAKQAPDYFPGVRPKGQWYKFERIHIGNDVWLGRNVLITNSANIGNGVIAGAGAVITKDVPDYAIVAGAPARIIRYRYSEEQIQALNKIAWWNWTDDKIREHYDDFYLDAEDFIRKFL